MKEWKKEKVESEKWKVKRRKKLLIVGANQKFINLSSFMENFETLFITLKDQLFLYTKNMDTTKASIFFSLYTEKTTKLSTSTTRVLGKITTTM